MTARILIADDEPNQLELLYYNLTKEGFEVKRAHDGREAIELAEDWRPDLIVLEWMMPEYSGIEVCRQLRKTQGVNSIPIIMLSARGEEGDEPMALIQGLMIISQTLSPRELVARIRAILRRANPAAAQQVRTFHDVTVNHAHMTVERSGYAIHLGPKEFKLLTVLMDRPGQVFSREQLLDAVWGHGVYVEDRTVDAHLSRLRKALNQAPDGEAERPDIVRTVRGAGYALKQP